MKEGTAWIWLVLSGAVTFFLGVIILYRWRFQPLCSWAFPRNRSRDRRSKLDQRQLGIAKGGLTEDATARPSRTAVRSVSSNVGRLI